MIINRYLAKEVYSTLVATTLILLVVFLSNQLVRLLQSAAAGEISGHAVALLILLALPHLLSLLLPLSLFLSILLAYGRLYADNEMTILASCGVSPQQLLKTTLQFSVAIIFLVGVLSLWIDPKVSNYSEQIVAGNTSTVLELLRPNSFQTINQGKWVIYVNQTSRDKKKLSEIFVAEQPSADSTKGLRPLGIISAQGGHQIEDHDTSDLFLVLTNGHRYEGVPGKKDFKIIQYSEYGIKLQQKVSDWQADNDNAPTTTLWQKRHDKFVATELQWRFSLPITAFILALLGTALSKIKPRRGRYAKLLPATICYIAYVQLLFLSRAWMKKGILSPLLGVWWVHLLFLCLAIYFVLPKRSKTRTQDINK